MAENLAFKASSGCRAYDNNLGNVTNYGYLYDWETAKASCPAGWHLPTVTEWETLIKFLGGEKVAGGKMKEKGTTNWNNPNTKATNEKGFTALPAGGYSDEEGFFSIGNAGYWWSSTSYFASSAIEYWVLFNYSSIYNSGNRGAICLSVRCVKD